MVHTVGRLVCLWALALAFNTSAAPLLDLRNSVEFNTFEEAYQRAKPDFIHSLSQLSRQPEEAANSLLHWFITWRNIHTEPGTPLADVYLLGIRKVFRPKFHDYRDKEARDNCEPAAMIYFLKWQWQTILESGPTPTVLRETLKNLHQSGSPFETFWSEGYRYLAQVAVDGESFRLGLLHGNFRSERQIADLCVSFFDRTGAKEFESSTTIEKILSELAQTHKMNPKRILAFMAESLGAVEGSEKLARAWLAYLRNVNATQTSIFHLKAGTELESIVRIRLLLLLNQLPHLKLTPAESTLVADTKNKVQNRSEWRALYNLEVQRAGCAAKIIHLLRSAP